MSFSSPSPPTSPSAPVPVQEEEITIYSLPSEEILQSGDGEIVESFLTMVQAPENHGRRLNYAYHESLQIGTNVGVYVPSAVTQKLKITVLELVDGQEKKCPPHIELPRDAVIEIDNTAEYQNVKIALVVQYKNKNFLFPIQGCMGQRGSAKQEERIRRFQGSRILFFSRAKMPTAPIKKKLKRLGVNHMSFIFFVNDKVVRDHCRREVLLTTENSVGTEQRYHVNKRAYKAFVGDNAPPSPPPPDQTNNFSFPFENRSTIVPPADFFSNTLHHHTSNRMDENMDSEKRIPVFNSHNNYSGPTDNTHLIFNNFDHLHRNNGYMLFKDHEDNKNKDFESVKRRRMDDLFLAMETLESEKMKNVTHDPLLSKPVNKYYLQLNN